MKGLNLYSNFQRGKYTPFCLIYHYLIRDKLHLYALIDISCTIFYISSEILSRIHFFYRIFMALLQRKSLCL